MKNRNKYFILILSLSMAFSASAFDTQNGKDLAGIPGVYQIPLSNTTWAWDFYGYNMAIQPSWKDGVIAFKASPYGDENYNNKKKIEGVLECDFGKAFCDTEIGKISSLRRTSPEWKDQYTVYDDSLKRMHDFIKSNGVYFVDASPTIQEDYDMEKGGFAVYMLGNVKDPIKVRIYALPTEMLMSNEVALHFERNMDDIHGNPHYGRKIFIPMKNLEVAMLFDESLPHKYAYSDPLSLPRKNFHTVYKCSWHEGVGVNTDKKPYPPYLQVDDIFIIYEPTNEIVWSIITGDHSENVHIKK